MESEIEILWDNLKKTSGKEQIKLFLEICRKLIALKNENKLSEEEAAYKIINGLQVPGLARSEECDAIFDIASTVEKPRTSSYSQPMGEWDEKTADILKQKEWRELVSAVEECWRVFEER